MHQIPKTRIDKTVKYILAKKMKRILLPKHMKCIQEIFVIVGASHLEYIPLLSKACLKEDKGSIDGPSLPPTSAYAQPCHYQA